MELPPGKDIDSVAVASPLEEISSAVRSGRLTELLKGRGLTGSTIEELLRPESAFWLKAILTDQLFPGRGRGPRGDLRCCGDSDPRSALVDRPGTESKVLAYKRERSTQ